MDPELVFPSEAFTTGRTLVRSLACVGHLQSVYLTLLSLGSFENLSFKLIELNIIVHL